MTDSVAAAKHILATCGVGLAPAVRSAPTARATSASASPNPPRP